MTKRTGVLPCSGVLIAFTALTFSNVAFGQIVVLPDADVEQVRPDVRFIEKPDALQVGVPIAQLPFTINECGRYFLTGCLTGEDGSNGITIQADDVTLDLNGFTLTGIPGSVDGISVNGGHVNVTVLNGVVRGWDDDGCDLLSVTGFQITGVHLRDNGGNGLRAGSNGIVRNSMFTENGANGLTGTAGLMVSQCVAAGNTLQGLSPGAHGTVVRCVARGNGSSGISAGGGTSMIDCTSSANQGDGIIVAGSSVARNCTAFNNSGAGIVSLAPGRNFIQGCSATLNVGAGITVAGAQSTIVGNQCVQNGGAGIHLGAGVSQCLVEDNHLTGNALGILVDHVDNLLLRNRVSPALDAYQFVDAANNSFGPIVDVERTGDISTIADPDNAHPWANFHFHP